MLCDLGASIKLMPLTVFRQLGLGAPKSKLMHLLMADHTVKKPMGIIYDLLVKVESFIFSADFIILDCEVDFDVSIILGRPFLATEQIPIEERLGVEALASVIMNFDIDHTGEYDEIVCALNGLGTFNHAPKRLDLDLKNRATLPAKPSIEEPPILEVKALPSHL
ncbi:uncharacterized protein LOC129875768 [Solanum dulcamara]|uniref:uncharacterized protein LOC129875768 n=1 Tax=Solanum dulcamara TaxID=45834 RepID=UPI002484E93D|nr:uncharacterized protein LOC129875768 [Solanum dulcamara]